MVQSAPVAGVPSQGFYASWMEWFEIDPQWGISPLLAHSHTHYETHPRLDILLSNSTPSFSQRVSEQMDYTSFSVYFTKLTPILSLAQQKTLEIEDLGRLPESAGVERLYEGFKKHWNTQSSLPAEQRSLWGALFKTVGYSRILMALILQIVASGALFQAPLLMKAINNSNSGVQVLSLRAYWILVSLTLVIPIVGTVCAQQARALAQYVGMQMRNLLAAAIYHKTLVRKSSQLETGLVTNLFVNDVKSIELVFLQFSNAVTM